MIPGARMIWVHQVTVKKFMVNSMSMIVGIGAHVGKNWCQIYFHEVDVLHYYENGHIIDLTELDVFVGDISMENIIKYLMIFIQSFWVNLKKGRGV
jgi:hypothetical protein